MRSIRERFLRAAPADCVAGFGWSIVVLVLLTAGACNQQDGEAPAPSLNPAAPSPIAAPAAASDVGAALTGSRAATVSGDCGAPPSWQGSGASSWTSDGGGARMSWHWPAMGSACNVSGFGYRVRRAGGAWSTPAEVGRTGTSKRYRRRRACADSRSAAQGRLCPGDYTFEMWTRLEGGDVGRPVQIAFMVQPKAPTSAAPACLSSLRPRRATTPDPYNVFQPTLTDRRLTFGFVSTGKYTEVSRTVPRVRERDWFAWPTAFCWRVGGEHWRASTSVEPGASVDTWATPHQNVQTFALYENAYIDADAARTARRSYQSTF